MTKLDYLIEPILAFLRSSAFLFARPLAPFSKAHSWVHVGVGWLRVVTGSTPDHHCTDWVKDKEVNRYDECQRVIV